MREIGLGDEEHAGCVAVEAVHDAGTKLAADSRQIAHVVEQGVDERARTVSRRGVHDEPRRLVDRDQVLVLVEDRQRDLLGLDRDGPGLRDLDLDLLAGPRPGETASRRRPRPAPRPPRSASGSGTATGPSRRRRGKGRAGRPRRAGRPENAGSLVIPSLTSVPPAFERERRRICIDRTGLLILRCAQDDKKTDSRLNSLRPVYATARLRRACRARRARSARR